MFKKHLFPVIAAIGFSTLSYAQTPNACTQPNKNVQSLMDSVQPRFENPLDKDSCAYADFFVKGGTDDTAWFEKIMSNAPTNIKRGGGSCLNDAMNSEGAENIGTMELAFRRDLCSDKDMQAALKSNNGTTKDYIRKKSKEFVAANKDYLAGGARHDEMMAQMKTDMEAYRQKNKCMEGVRPSFTPNTYPYAWTVASSTDDHKTRIEGDKNKQAKLDEVNEFMTKNGDKARRFCSPPVYNGSPMKTVYQIPISDHEIRIPIKQTMAANVSTFTPDQVKAVNDQIMSDPLVAKNTACGRTIQKIEIQASSSKLGNTGSARDDFTVKDANGTVTQSGRWNFHDLSQARADNFKDQVLSQLKLPGFDGSKQADMSKKVTSRLGENQSGASGDCPYELVAHGNKYAVVEKAEYRNDPKKAKKLQDDNQYLRAVVRFSDEPCNGEKISVNSPVYETRVFVDNCMEVHYECR